MKGLLLRALAILERRPVATAAVAALVFHGLFLALLPSRLQVNESSDFTEFYRPVAERLLDGEGLVDSEGRVATRYPPGFPVLIAATVRSARGFGGDEELWLRLLNAVCVALSTILVVRLCRALAGEGLVAGIAGLMWAAYPPFLWLAKQANSELPFLVLLLAGLSLWHRTLDGASARGLSRSSGAAALAGGLIGLATLIRPFSLLLTPVLALTAFGWRLPRRRLAVIAVAVLAGQAVVLAPWELWLHRQTGAWLPVSSGGRLSLLDGLTVGAEEGEPVPVMSDRVLALTHDIEAHRSLIRGPREAAAFLLDRAGKTPLAVLELLGLKAARAFYGTESVRFEGLLLALQIPLLALALAGLVSMRRRPGTWLILGVVLYSWAMTVLVLSILRYMVPAMALLMAPIAWTLVAFAHRWRLLEPDRARD